MMREANRLWGLAALVVAVLLLGGCSSTENANSASGVVPPSAAKVQVKLKGTLSSASEEIGTLSSEGCETSPTHVVLRLSYPDDSFYVRRLSVDEIRGASEVTFYAPPGDDVILYAVAVRRDPEARNWFNIYEPFEPLNLVLSGYRHRLGKIDEGEAYSVEIDLSRLVPFDFEITADRDPDASWRFVPEVSGSYAYVPFRVKVSWVPEGQSEFDPQGPTIFSQNGYACIEYLDGECQEWAPDWGTSDWGTAEPKLSLRNTHWPSGDQVEFFNHMGPLYVTGINFGFPETIRFYMPSTTCAPVEGKTTFWVKNPRLVEP